MADIRPIPGPVGLPFLGNILSLMGEEVPILGFERLADIYGPIYQLTIKGKRVIVVSSAELTEELMDEKRFPKKPPLALDDEKAVRGLFAATNDDPDWGQAHRILIQPLGPLSVERMFDDMKDIANQLLLKWARKGPEDRILITDDFTRLTLDTIALCTMKYRFNSFYSTEMHPFVDAMLNVLLESGARTTRPAFISAFRYAGNAKFLEDEAMLKKTAQQIIDNRRANPTDENDLLNAMVCGKDPKTGEKMRDELIIAQMNTFLIAGHETTSGLLSFTFLYLLKNGQAYLKAQQEVDDVLGGGSIHVGDLKKLKYLNACLRESIRLSPTAPAVTKQTHSRLHNEVVLLGGKYKIEPTDRVLVLLGKTQKDAKVYGEDAAEFKPERMLDENFDKLPEGAWKPFGNGTRACIGQPFAWQEALMVTALILQNFNLRLDDPSYELKLKQTLTIKPRDLHIRTTLRDGIDASLLDRRLHSTNGNLKEQLSTKNGNHKPATPANTTLTPMTILFGSNTGTCQAFAQRLSSDAVARGFKPNVLDMDSATGTVPKGQPVIIITSSYEGQPPENAARFVNWLQEGKPNHLEGVEFSVFGCGHKDWVKTFHRIPMLTDKLMEEAGARRIAPIGLSDVSQGNIFGHFEDWEDEVLWPRLTVHDNVSHHDFSVSAEISTNARASSLRHDVSIGTVKENRSLTAPGEPPKWHMEVQLPSDITYECGDYLAVLPLNSDKSVQRVMAHFQLPWDAVMTLGTNGTTPLMFPQDTPLSIFDVLRGYVELAHPATKKSVKICSQYAVAADDISYLQKLSLDSSTFNNEIVSKNVSVFDILHGRTSIAVPFATFLGLLPPLRVRQYSISSSPLASSDTCTLTYAVIEQPALCNPDMVFEGVAGKYLSTLKSGDRLQVSVRTTANKSFRMPADDQNTPMLMFAAGTGLAPFRGFLEQRAIQLAANPDRKLAKAVIFLGCRSKTSDRIYAEKLDRWVEAGVVDVRYAFSREPESSEGCRYVSDRMKHDSDLVRQLWKDGAKVYLCGSRAFDKSVGEAARAMVIEQRLGSGRDEGGVMQQDVDQWFAGVASERIATDIFD